MRCGKCGAEAASVDEVKACYGGVGDAHKPLGDKFTDDGLKEVKEDEPFNPPSEKQVDYLLGLQDSRIHPEGYKPLTRGEAYLTERPDISSRIELLKYCQKKDAGSHQRKWENIPEGRYALYAEAGPGYKTGSWKFYQVDKPKEGRWAGYTFVKVLIGAPGSYRKESVGMSRAMDVLAAIDKDPKQAMVDYGLQSGVCGRCSSPLTDPDSLARGIGPKCAAKSGWF